MNAQQKIMLQKLGNAFNNGQSYTPINDQEIVMLDYFVKSNVATKNNNLYTITFQGLSIL